LMAAPLNSHEHVSDAEYKREITVCVYDDSPGADLDGLGERARNVIRSSG
jgi:hypothetical protein